MRRLSELSEIVGWINLPGLMVFRLVSTVDTGIL